MKTFEFWPIVLYANEIKINSKWLDFVKNIAFRRMDIGNGNISENIKILNEERLSDLKQEIENNLKNYCENVLKIKHKFNITTSWCVKQNTGDWGQPHEHKNSLISGVYYLKTPENSGDLFFHRNVNHLLSANLAFETLEDTNINNDLIKFNVKEGMIIIFPSNVFHSIGKTNSIDSRYCIAFNSYIVGDISKYNEGSLHIKDVE